MHRVVAAVALAATACMVHTEFRPHSATTRYRPVVETAVLAYDRDIPTLAAAGAEVVGTITARGNGFSSPSRVRYDAARDAAGYGGTHVVVAAERDDTDVVRVTADRAVTRVSGGTVVTTYEPGARVPVTRHTVYMVVVRVPPCRWRELPDGLRPQTGAREVVPCRR